MDPSEDACRVYDTFTEEKPVYEPADFPYPFVVKSPSSLTLEIKTATKKPVALYENKKMYEELQSFKEEASPFIRNVEDTANPFSKLGESAFHDKNSVKLANIDAVYKLTGHYSTLLKQRLDQTYERVGTTTSTAYKQPVGLFREDKDFIFCAVNDEGGGFVNYLQFRIKHVHGYGMNEGGWNIAKLNTGHFTPTYGDNGIGDLSTNWEYFIGMVRRRVPKGVQLVVANGGHNEEETNLFLEEALVGIGCCGEGGSAVIKVFDTTTRVSAEWLYLFAQCFEAIDLFKPVTSSPFSSEKYLVGLQRRSDDVVNLYIEMLKKVRTSFDHDDAHVAHVQHITQILKDSLPEDFVVWLTENNDTNLLRQKKIWERIVRLQRDEKVDIPQYNLRTALKIWSIPGNIPVEREFKGV